LGLNDLKVNQRYIAVSPLCALCDVVEDEMHFLFSCKLYDDLRAKYLSKYLTGTRNCPAVVKYLVSNENADITRDVCLFAAATGTLRALALFSTLPDRIIRGEKNKIKVSNPYTSPFHSRTASPFHSRIASPFHSRF
jgi:hypothetical protein